MSILMAAYRLLGNIHNIQEWIVRWELFQLNVFTRVYGIVVSGCAIIYEYNVFFLVKVDCCFCEKIGETFSIPSIKKCRV